MIVHNYADSSHSGLGRRYDSPMADNPNEIVVARQVVLCDTCARFVLERYKVARAWREGRRCIAGVRFAGERTDCRDYCREPGSDDE